MKHLFGTTVFALAVALLFSCGNKKKTDDELKNITASYSAHCPIKISEDMQLDSVYSLPEKNIVYKYTLTLLTPDAFNQKQYEAEMRPYIVKEIKKSEEMAYLRELQVSFHYEYYAPSGKLLSKITVQPKDYE